MKAEFEIQNVVSAGQRTYVIASLLTPTDFAVSIGSKLGGCRLKSLEARSTHGRFTFMLESPTDSSRLMRGAVVELTD